MKHELNKYYIYNTFKKFYMPLLTLARESGVAQIQVFRLSRCHHTIVVLFLLKRSNILKYEIVTPKSDMRNYHAKI